MNPEEKTYPSLQGCLHRKLEIRGREGRFKPIPTGPTRATYRLGPREVQSACRLFSGRVDLQGATYQYPSSTSIATLSCIPHGD